MPTNRTRRAHKRKEIDFFLTRMHIEGDGCLLAGAGEGCACGWLDYHGRENQEIMAKTKAFLAQEKAAK